MSFLTLLLLLHLIVALPVCAHILLTKSESSALPWIGLVLISPFLGAGFYWILGINRVERRARRYRGRAGRQGAHYSVPQAKDAAPPFAGLPTHHQRQLFNYESAVHDAPFMGGNSVTPLIGAAEAFPDMLKAIDEAKTSVALSVYIFDTDEVGCKFIEALTAAHARGVKVLVLVDEIGMGAKPHAADTRLAEAGIATARFIPQKLKFLPMVNLRNHRKIMIIDGTVGFIGGMNICLNYGETTRAADGGLFGSGSSGSGSSGSDGKGVGRWRSRGRYPGRYRGAVRDMHFRVTGPALEQMSAIFEEDWKFAAGESVMLPAPPADQARSDKPQYVRIVPDGPDTPFQRTMWIMMGALALAQKSVHILTPYFLPNDVLTHAMAICALRGVDVRVVVPASTDIKLVDWAMRAKFQALLEHGVKIYTGGKPFDHSKMMVVDDAWVLVGSSNWDQRSLRLNFEANLECYDEGLAAKLEAHYQAMQAQAQLVSLAALKALPTHIRLRNNIARLFTPYL